MGGYVKKYTAAQLYRNMLAGPFEFCRSLLDLPIRRVYCTVYELGHALSGGASDFVFMGDVLVHTLRPLDALVAVASVCRGSLLFAGLLAGTPEDAPAMHYVGGEDVGSDEVSWWLPNQACLAALLKKLGFRNVVDVGKHRGVLRPSGFVFERSILRAER